MQEPSEWKRGRGAGELVVEFEGSCEHKTGPEFPCPSMPAGINIRPVVHKRQEYNLLVLLHIGVIMKIKAIYEHEVLKPLKKLDLKDGEEVELTIKKKISERTFGLIKLDHNTIEEIIDDTEYGSW